MKRAAQSIFIALLLIPLAASAVLVDGYCYLENQTIHDSIKVKFEADSPTAVTDSCYTDSSGYYQINLSAGFYDVFFTHPGFYNTPLFNQNCWSAVTLQTMTLQQMEPHLAGALSGVIEPGYYIIDADISVQQGDSLIIRPGTTFMFWGNYDFTIYGYLQAIGTEIDSIRFRPYDPGLYWQGLYFEDSASDSSTMAYCIVFKANNGISIDNANPSINYCRFRGNTNQGLSVLSSTLDIDHCVFSDNSDKGIKIQFGVVNITNCSMDNNSGVGIYCVSSAVVIENCVVEDNGGGGIYLNQCAFPGIVNNIIQRNTATAGGGIFCNNSNIYISGNNISDNLANAPIPRGGGIYLSYCSPAPVIENNIIEGNYLDGGSGSYRYFYGAGIYCLDSAPEIRGNTITGNYAEELSDEDHVYIHGGGLYGENSAMQLDDNTFQSNSLSGGAGEFGYFYLFGAGIEVRNCSVDLYNNIITDNSMIGITGMANAYYFFGAGLYLDSSNVSITENYIARNDNFYSEGDLYGGGLCCKTITQSSLIERNNIIDNSSKFGGGIALINSSPQIKYNNISQNTASDGGGIHCGAYPANIENCALYGNSGGGITITAPLCNITNTIISGTIGAAAIEFLGSMSLADYCDFYDNQQGNFSGGAPQYIGIIVTVNANGDSCDMYHNIYFDPQFIAPAQGTFSLFSSSPCIDAGDPDSPLDPDSTIADIGAFYFDQSLPMIEDLVIIIEGDDVILNWSAIPAAISYNIYRSEDPYASISTLIPIATTNGTTFTDVGAASGGSWFYALTYVSEP